jgi:DNA polymerase-3 subunit delta'
MYDEWEGIYGQENAIRILTQLISTSQIPHAYIFKGINGTGKELTAIRFITSLNCKSNPSKNESSIKHKIEIYSEPYVKYIFPFPRGKKETSGDEPFEKLTAEEMQIIQNQINSKINNPYYKISIPKANQIRINSIRDINKFIALDYSDIYYRLILISEAHLMNEDSQNALLKNLEEPPHGVVFVLTTPYPEKLFETIRSRCWQLNFQPLQPVHIKEILMKYFKVEEHLAEAAAPFGNGSVIASYNLIEHDFESLLEKTISVLRYSFGRKYHSAFIEISKLIDENAADTLRLLIQMMIIWLNDVQKYRLGINDCFFNKHRETLEKFTTKFPNLNLVNITYKLDSLAASLQNNINVNLVLLNLIIELSNLIIKKGE